MALISAFAVLALVVSADGSVGPSTNSSFCTDSKECLEYELVCKTDEYEVRHYSLTRWVSTDAVISGVAAAMAFKRLSQYIIGANVGGIQMEMVYPVLVKIPEKRKMWENNVYTISFPLPSAYQNNSPEPTNDTLYFTEMPEMDVYVSSYGGWVTSRVQSHPLTEELKRVRASYNRSFHYAVGYSPINRHDEVWYVAEGEPVCTDPQEPTPAHIPLQNVSPDFPSFIPFNVSSASNSSASNSSASNSSASNSSTSNLSLQLSSSDMLNLSSSIAPTSPSSNLSAETTSSNESNTNQTLLDPMTNSSDPVSASLSLEPLSNITLWNTTTDSSVDQQVASSPVVEPDDAH